MIATVRHVTAWAGRTKFQTDGFLFVGVYTLMYLQIICFTECIIKHTTGICTFHSMYPTLKRKKGPILLFWKEGETLWNVSYRSVTQILYQKTCVLYQIPLALWSRITSKDVAKSVSKFGGILFTPIRALEGQAFIQEPECTPPSLKPLHKHRYIYIQTQQLRILPSWLIRFWHCVLWLALALEFIVGWNVNTGLWNKL